MIRLICKHCLSKKYKKYIFPLTSDVPFKTETKYVIIEKNSVVKIYRGDVHG